MISNKKLGIFLLKETILNWRFWVGVTIGALASLFASFLAINTKICFFERCF